MLAPRRWRPPVSPPRARRSTGDRPLPSVRLYPLGGDGPEDVVVDRAGRVLAGVADGRVLRLDPITGEVETLAETGGRPLGLEVCPDATVLVCDSRRGLLRLDPADGSLTTLLDTVDGQPLSFASNVVAAPDGSIYLSTSTSRFTLEHYMGDLLEHSTTGRLLRLRPDGSVDTLLAGLAFGNGVVLDPAGRFVLVAQTGAYCVTRYWVTGPLAGRSEPFVDNLAGFPDNMSLSSDGLVWVAIAAPRDRLLDRLLPLPGALRTLVWALPDRLRPAPARTTWVMAFDLDGVLVHDLQATPGTYRMVTGVCEHDGRVYLGSLLEPAVACFDLAG